MPRYINADALYKDFENDLFCLKFGSALQGTPRSEIDISNVLERIENAPTEDVMPVKHGHWAKENLGIIIRWNCSACCDCYYLGEPNAKYDFSVQENTAQTIVARGSGVVANIDRMIVRRLMPVEEARLQGFPDWWCADVPHKDTPEYRMWGNGVALPCVLYVMEGIAECMK